jgi:hypothetical protein
VPRFGVGQQCPFARADETGLAMLALLTVEVATSTDLADVPAPDRGSAAY